MNERLIECFEDTLRLCESTELKTKTENAKSSSKVYLEGFVQNPTGKKRTRILCSKIRRHLQLPDIINHMAELRC